MLKTQSKSSPFFFSSDLSSEEFYSTLEKVEEPSFSPLVPDKNEMSLRLTLAQHYLEIEDRENALTLLEEVRWRGQKPEKDLAEKLLNQLGLK
jgi:FimV-like protein